MSIYDANGIDRVPFDGRYDRIPETRLPTTLRNHGSQCSANPAIGCNCDRSDKPRPSNRSARFGSLPLSNESTPFSRSADADPKVQERRKLAFEAQELLRSQYDGKAS